jgi:hypothetical protein
MRRCEFEVGDYGPKDPSVGQRNDVVLAADLIALHRWSRAVTQSTATVDNFVGNLP